MGCVTDAHEQLAVERVQQAASGAGGAGGCCSRQAVVLCFAQQLLAVLRREILGDWNDHHGCISSSISSLWPISLISSRRISRASCSWPKCARIEASIPDATATHAPHMAHARHTQ